MEDVLPGGCTNVPSNRHTRRIMLPKVVPSHYQYLSKITPLGRR